METRLHGHGGRLDMLEMKGLLTGRKMRRCALAFAALLLAGTAFAGPHGGGHHRGPDPARMLDHMTAELDLSAGQREEIRAILESRREETRALHRQLRENHRELRNLDPSEPNYQTLANTLAQRRGELTSRMTLLRSQSHADIMKVLDEEQQAKLTEMRSERMAMDQRRQKLRQRMHGQPAGPADGPADVTDDESGATEENLL
jgi:Spy/CpxP family protein refolding chaperone